MAIVVLLLFVLIVAFYKELLVVAFDRQLAACLGMHPRLVRYGLMTVLSIVIVGSFTSVGAILVVAMLIAPAATAYLLTHRLWQMFAWCVVAGGLSSLIGFHLAYWLSVSTGGAMSCAACGLFGLAFLFSPSQGLLAVAWRRARLRTRMTVENAVRALLKISRDPEQAPLTARNLATHLQTSTWRLRWVLKRLRRRGWIEFDPELPLGIGLTATGLGVAHRLDRTHRLWEKYLVEQVGLPSDHVHTTAEEVEHLLSEQFVERVDDLLGHPDLDPHGSPIPRSPINDLAPGVFTLSKLRVGDRGRIVGLAVPLGAAGETPATQSSTDRTPGSPVTEPEPTADSIAALGLPLGQPFTVIERDVGEHSWTIEARPGQPIVLPHRLADLLLVQPEDEPS
jgi:Mn-dependent DtxR family transcriptional regulator